MNPFAAYRIPFLGLKIGKHAYEFELDETFFSSFEQSEITGGLVKAQLQLEKQSTMMVLDFELEGSVHGICDRCGDPIEVNVEHHDRLIVKYGEQTGSTDEEILVVGPSEHLLELHQFLYEFAHLGLPARMVHTKERDCNQEAIRLLRELNAAANDDDEDDDEDDDDVDPRWEELKKLK